MGWSSTPNEEYVTSKIQRGTLGIVPLLQWQEGPDATIYASPSRDYLNVPHITGALEISLE